MTRHKKISRLSSKILRNSIYSRKWEADETQVISKVEGLLSSPLEKAPTVYLIKKFLSKYGFKKTLKVFEIEAKKDLNEGERCVPQDADLSKILKEYNVLKLKNNAKERFIRQNRFAGSIFDVIDEYLDVPDDQPLYDLFGKSHKYPSPPDTIDYSAPNAPPHKISDVLPSNEEVMGSIKNDENSGDDDDNYVYEYDDDIDDFKKTKKFK